MKQLRMLFIGLIAGVLLATAGTGYAKTIVDKVTATVRGDFNVYVDGKKAELKNAPLAVDGSSYLPVRELAELLGKDVDFKDGDIKIDTPKEIVTMDDWITLNEATETFGLYIEVGAETTKISDIEFASPDARYDGIIHIETGKGTLQLKIENSRFYLSKENLSELSLVQ